MHQGHLVQKDRQGRLLILYQDSKLEIQKLEWHVTVAKHMGFNPTQVVQHRVISLITVLCCQNHDNEYLHKEARYLGVPLMIANQFLYVLSKRYTHTFKHYEARYDI